MRMTSVTSGQIEVRRNYNGGNNLNWNSTDIASSFTPFDRCRLQNTMGVWCIRGLGGNATEIRVTGSPTMALDPTGGVHVAFASHDPTSLGDIMYIKSSTCQKGTACAFSAPIKINIDGTALNPNADQFEPALSISAKFTPYAVYVTAYDRRDNSANQYWKPWFYHCHLDANCALPSNWVNAKLNEQGSTNTDSSSFIGDYHAVISTSLGELFSTWEDTRDTIVVVTNYD